MLVCDNEGDSLAPNEVGVGPNLCEAAKLMRAKVSRTYTYGPAPDLIWHLPY
jgi:hypothetical protein